MERRVTITVSESGEEIAHLYDGMSDDARSMLLRQARRLYEVFPSTARALGNVISLSEAREKLRSVSHQTKRLLVQLLSIPLVFEILDTSDEVREYIALLT